MIRVLICLFGADGSAYSCASCLTDTADEAGAASAVRGQWDTNVATAFAFFGPGADQAYSFTAKP